MAAATAIHSVVVIVIPGYEQAACLESSAEQVNDHIHDLLR